MHNKRRCLSRQHSTMHNAMRRFAAFHLPLDPNLQDTEKGKPD